MNEIDPKILEVGKRTYGDECELVKRTEWSYSYKCGEKSYCSISRFLAETGFQVSASDVRQKWPRMSERERLDFASNFHVREDGSDNDTEILEIIMHDGSDLIWSSCAQAMLRHPDRNRAIAFLIDRIVSSESEHPPLNYMQALGLMEAQSAVPVIRPYYEKYLKAMEAETVTGVPDDVFFGPIPYHAFLAIAGDLFRITRSEEYRVAICRYFEHAEEQVRWWAEHALDVKGPTTLKRNEKYAKTGRFP
ncbi:MAG TPA: hypothetical protein VKQ11_01880 [Candidatus Sulfotelmatobacter sp.]|nr:hypothetical protein [Candidatus Sulfotelmatobacter sp.]